MEELIRKLEAATEGSWELDREVQLVARQWDIFPDKPTRSLDAAMLLVPDGLYWSLWCSARWKDGGAYFATVFQSGGGWIDDSPKDLNRSTAPTPALALCIASLRAREAGDA